MFQEPEEKIEKKVEIKKEQPKIEEKKEEEEEEEGTNIDFEKIKDPKILEQLVSFMIDQVKAKVVFLLHGGGERRQSDKNCKHVWTQNTP